MAIYVVHAICMAMVSCIDLWVDNSPLNRMVRSTPRLSSLDCLRTTASLSSNDRHPLPGPACRDLVRWRSCMQIVSKVKPHLRLVPRSQRSVRTALHTIGRPCTIKRTCCTTVRTTISTSLVGPHRHIPHDRPRDFDRLSAGVVEEHPLLARSISTYTL